MSLKGITGDDDDDDDDETFLQLINQNQELVNSLLMSDEVRFHLSAFANKQIFHYCSATHPTELHERPLHSSKVTVRCTISSFGIISPYFFEDGDRGGTVVKVLCYKSEDHWFDPSWCHWNFSLT